MIARSKPMRRFLGLAVAYRHTRDGVLAGRALRAELRSLADLGADDDAWGVLVAQSHVAEVRELMAQFDRRPRRAD